jgi:8-oxo-dGTP pyrophosphatase MutT (NUDIX family)
VAAILVVGAAYALQLRDAAPAPIAYPGRWGLFGGACGRREPARRAVRREILEELALDVEAWRPLGTVTYRSGPGGPLAACALFEADVTGTWDRHRLREGRGARLFPAAALPRPMVPLARAVLRWHARGGRVAVRA